MIDYADVTQGYDWTFSPRPETQSICVEINIPELLNKEQLRLDVSVKTLKELIQRVEGVK